MSGYREFSPGDPFPSDYPNALGEFLATATENFLLRIKPTDATVLQVPASAGDGRAAISIGGKWRYVDVNVERASPGGGAATFDVYVTASDNDFASSGDGEVDSTVYAFALAIMASGVSPVGVALYRKVGSAPWDGAKFTAVDVLVGAQAGAPRHAATHAAGGSDPVTPASIGAASTAHAATHEQGASDALIGAWEPLTLGAGVGQGAADAASGRLEFGDTCRLLAGLTNTSGAGIVPGSTLATVPGGVGLRPARTITLVVSVTAPGVETPTLLTITSGGLVQLGAPFQAGATLSLDGQTFPTNV
jgi:hypothetical protein